MDTAGDVSTGGRHNTQGPVRHTGQRGLYTRRAVCRQQKYHKIIYLTDIKIQKLSEVQKNSLLENEHHGICICFYFDI